MAGPNPELRERVRALFGAGLSHSALADQLAVTKGAVSGIVYRLGLKDPAATVNAAGAWTAEEDAALIRMDAEGLTPVTIEPHIPGRTVRAIGARLTRLRREGRVPAYVCPARGIVAPNRKYDDALIDRIRDMRVRQGLPRAAICEATGLDMDQLNGVMSRYKIALKGCAKASSSPAVVDPILEGWPVILRWWRDNAPPKEAAKFPAIGDVNELRRSMGRRPYTPMGGLLSPAGRREGW